MQRSIRMQKTWRNRKTSVLNLIGFHIWISVLFLKILLQLARNLMFLVCTFLFTVCFRSTTTSIRLYSIVLGGIRRCQRVDFYRPPFICTPKEMLQIIYCTTNVRRLYIPDLHGRFAQSFSNLLYPNENNTIYWSTLCSDYVTKARSVTQYISITVQHKV